MSWCSEEARDVAVAAWEAFAARAPLRGPLQPPLRPRDPRRFHAVAGSQLADRFGKIVPHGALGETEFRRDVAARLAVSGQAQDLPLAVGAERVGSPHASVANSGSITRNPWCTRRTASANCSAGRSFRRYPDAPASSARRRSGSRNVVTMTTRWPPCGV